MLIHLILGYEISLPDIDLRMGKVVHKNAKSVARTPVISAFVRERQMTESTNKRVVKQAVSALNDRDRSELADYVAEHAINHTPFGTRRGKEAYIESAFAGFETYPNLSYSPTTYVAEADFVAVFMRLAGTQKGAYRDVIEPTNNEIAIPVMQFHRFADGKIVETWTVLDRLEPLEQLEALHDWQIRMEQLNVLNRILRHNLRNDLGAILGYADLIHHGTEETTAYAETIRKLAQNLLVTGEKAHKLEHQIVSRPSKPTKIDIDELFERVLSEFQQSLTDGAITVETTSTVDSLHTDSALLETALHELVENSIVHNSHDGLVIEITASVVSENPRQIELLVADNGCGINPGEYQALTRATETPLVHGSGIGLWAVRWCVKRIDGTIEFEGGTHTSGTTVAFRIPDSP